ncbi:hypothetical protein CR513_41471, partial [Mucuna pruriens]
MSDITQFTPLKVGRSQILREVFHTCLLDIPLPTEHQLKPGYDEWCEFHPTHEHTMKNCRTLKGQIEKLVHEGHLSRFVQTQGDTRAKEHNHPWHD